MARNWENILLGWSSPPGSTEASKCDNAERGIKKAIGNSNSLSSRDTTVFTQGSYRNRTNVRADSDVDVCVLCKDTFYYHIPDGLRREDFGITPATYDYRTFKNEVYSALIDQFGNHGVSWGNKAFDVHENTYRVDADVVACFEYRLYFEDGGYASGTSFIPDNGSLIDNWPEQNYRNGVNKNTATGRRYKDLVRILKRLRNEMLETGDQVATNIPSYLLECLVYNVPNQGFGHSTYTEDVRFIVADLYNNTRTSSECRDWCEINGLKYLFHTSQPWTRQQVNIFLDRAWDFIGLDK